MTDSPPRGDYPIPPDLWVRLAAYCDEVRRGMSVIPRIVLELHPNTGQVTAIVPEVRIKHRRTW